MGDPDAHAIRTWHYPLNEPKRQYQYDVVQDCLLANTLIVLPNGLGTMFIVSVVAHNFLRWFPEGKAVFLASTRTLLRQQMQSARAITEIRAESMAELTSSQNSEQRLRLWSSKSLLLSTPQLLRNDLISGICHYDNIVLLILDEARRAAENRLYYEIVQFLKENGRLEHVRIIALSSTSSSTISAVQRLVSSLFISRVFLRTVKSPDVAPYVHFKEIERIIVPESSSIKFLRSQFEKHFLQPPIARLKDLGYLEGMELDTLSHSKLLDLGRGRHNSERGKSTKLGVAKETLGSLTLLYYAYELLISYGMIPFRAFFKKSLTEASFPAQTRLHDELSSVPAFHQLMAYVDKLLESSLFSGHPKIDIAEERLRELAIGKSGAMMIVVSRCRDSALELASRLARNSPLLRAMSFAPQPSRVNPNSQKISQKQQTEALERFKIGGYNTLVTTGIDGEGIDLSNFDMVIYFASQPYPINPPQAAEGSRAPSEGRIILMLTEGLEEKRYSDVVSKQEGLEQAMSDSVAFSLFKPNHCLIPAEPRCVERVFVDEGKTTSTAPVRERGSSRRAGNSTRAGREPRSTDSRGQEPICDPERCYTAEPRGSSGPVLALEGPDQNSNQLPMLRCGADGETAFAREQLQRCNLEMRVSHHPSRTPLSWTACCNEFEKMFKTVYVSRVETALLDLPADFFDSSDISEVNQPPVREIPEHIEASDELVGIRCVRRPPIFKTSSSVDTEGSKGQHGEPRNRFVDDEAACSNSAESATEDEEISTSMAQFIIDGSNPNSNTSRSRENDDEMMAFYRRTAHASQNDSIFAQPPKRFATSRKPLALPPAAETTDAGDDTDFGGLDWISDIEIP